MKSTNYWLTELESTVKKIVDAKFGEYNLYKKENPENTKDDFFKFIFPNFQEELARAGTDIVHRAIIDGGIEDNDLFNFGIITRTTQGVRDLLKLLLDK